MWRAGKASQRRSPEVATGVVPWEVPGLMLPIKLSDRRHATCPQWPGSKRATSHGRPPSWGEFQRSDPTCPGWFLQFFGTHLGSLLPTHDFLAPSRIPPPSDPARSHARNARSQLVRAAPIERAKRCAKPFSYNDGPVAQMDRAPDS